MKTKRLLSIILAVLLIGTAFVLPLSADALGSSGAKDITSQITWEQGAMDSSDIGLGKPISTTKGIRTNFLSVAYSSKITITPFSSGMRMFFYTDNTNTTKATSYQNCASTITIPDGTKYIRIQKWDDAGITPSNAPSITLNIYPIVAATQIDANKTGTLKIYKYEMDDTSSANTNGLGYDSEKSNVPSGATPLNGVTFEIKRVVAIDTTGIYYYDSSGTKHNYTIYDGTGFTDQTLAQMVATFKTYKPLNNSGGTTSVPTRTQVTTTVGSDQGVAQFTNLPLGIYLVQEKSGPAQITKKVDDFVVSIPRISTDRLKWEYSTSVFPKNETTYKSVKIEKRDGSASGTPLITSSNASFTLERSEDNSTFTSVGTLTTSSGVVTKTNLPVNNYYKLTETTAPTGYIKDTAGSKNVTYFYLDADGKILSRDKSTTISSPSGTTPAVLSIKNYKPAIRKDIDCSKGNGTSTTSIASITRSDDDNNFQYYVVRVTTPNIASAMSTLKTFEVTDSLSCVKSSIQPVIHKITYGSSITAANSNVLATSAYTYTCTQDSSTNTTFNTKIVFDTSKLAKNQNYFIYYKCYVAYATTNAAKLKYSTVTSGTDTTSEITSNTVKFINGSYFLTKTNGSGAKLQGAEFKLYSTLEDARSDKNAVFAHDVNYDIDTYIFKSQSDGTVKIRNIDLGINNSSATRTYYLVETKAPTGYNLLAEPITITVTTTSGNSSQITVVNTNTLTFPLTGSTGLMIFIIIGSLMLGTAVVILLIKKRKMRTLRRS